MHKERQIGKKKSKVKRSYLVKWLGYGDEHNSWGPEANLNSACLQEYWDTVKLHCILLPSSADRHTFTHRKPMALCWGPFSHCTMGTCFL